VGDRHTPLHQQPVHVRRALDVLPVDRELTHGGAARNLHPPSRSLQEPRRAQRVIHLQHEALHGGRALPEVRQSPLEDQPPCVHDPDVRRHLLHLAQQMARQEHRESAVRRERTEERPHLADAGGVEPVGGLVQDQQLRLAEQRERQAYSLVHPQRVGPHQLGAVGCEPHDLERRAHPRPRRPQQPPRDLEVLLPRQVGIE
jgi:hypothetical protein